MNYILKNNQNSFLEYFNIITNNQLPNEILVIIINNYNYSDIVHILKSWSLISKEWYNNTNSILNNYNIKELIRLAIRKRLNIYLYIIREEYKQIIDTICSTFLEKMCINIKNNNIIIENNDNFNLFYTKLINYDYTLIQKLMSLNKISEYNYPEIDIYNKILYNNSETLCILLSLNFIVLISEIEDGYMINISSDKSKIFVKKGNISDKLKFYDNFKNY